MQSPQIDSRNYQSLVAQTEALVSQLTSSTVGLTYDPDIDIPALVNHTLKTPIIDPADGTTIIAKAGQWIDLDLAGKIVAAHVVSPIFVNGWMPASLSQSVSVASRNLVGQVLDEDIYREKIAAGTKLDLATIARLKLPVPVVDANGSIAVLPPSQALDQHTLAEDIYIYTAVRVVARPGEYITTSVADSIGKIAHLLIVKMQGDPSYIVNLPSLLVGHFLDQEVTDPAGNIIKIPRASYIDSHLADDLARTHGLTSVQARKSENAPGETPPEQNDVGATLIRIFAYFSQLIIERINKLPEKNYQAYLNLLGVQILPPQPARVPLTFTLVNGGTASALVPAYTAVAAPPIDGSTDEVTFETDKDLVVTAAKLQSIILLDPATQLYSDVTQCSETHPFKLFVADQQVEHQLFVAYDPIFTKQTSTKVTIQVFSKDATSLAAMRIEWAYWDGSTWQLLAPHVEAATNRWSVAFTNLPIVTALEINKQKAGWLRARLTDPQPNAITIDQVLLEIDSAVPKNAPQLPDAAYFNNISIDLTKAIYPFGETPRINDTFYMRSDAILSKAGEQVDITIKASPTYLKQIDPSGTNSFILTTEIHVAWEMWTGQGWTSIVNDSPYKPPATVSPETFTASASFTITLPKAVAKTTVIGIEGYWLRARIVSGNYGGPVSYVADDHGGYKWTPATYTPPLVESIVFSYEHKEIGLKPSALQTFNNLEYVDHTAQSAPFALFDWLQDQAPALYLGFDKLIKQQSVNLFVQVIVPDPDAVSPTNFASKDSLASAQLIWEYRTVTQWRTLGIVDQTQKFARSDLLQFILPDDAELVDLLGKSCCWIRVCQGKGMFPILPQIGQFMLNTVWATQARTISNENLGSSTGNPDQVFNTSQAPVLLDPVVEVRESVMLSAEEQAALLASQSLDSLRVLRDATGRIEEIWTQWLPVANFATSGPRDRHYMIDHLTGQIRFGDGRYGMIPPQGSSNIQATRYRTGGGNTGNRAAQTIKSLKSSIPFIASVTNLIPAEGGAPQETIDSAMQRGPRFLRHRNRATTQQDIIDLAFEASPNVARVQAVGPASSWRNPWLKHDDVVTSQYYDTQTAGQIGLIIVPRSRASQPSPDIDLMRQVQTYIAERATPTARIWVSGPEWAQVQVNADIVPTGFEVADQLLLRAIDAVEQFLHPLYGGFDGQGWPFGRTPYPSDLYALFARVEGLDHVRTLVLSFNPKLDDLDVYQRSHYLVVSGKHEIQVVLE